MGYKILKQLVDLEEAIKICQTAIKVTSSDSPNFALYLFTLGSILLAYFVHREQQEILDQAILNFQRAVECVTDDAPDVFVYFANLGTALYQRYTHLGRLEDLDQAIEAHQKAVKFIPSTSPGFPTMLGHLSEALWSHYQRLGKLEDLHQAIIVAQRALEYSSDELPEQLAASLSILGNALNTRYEHSGQIEDLENAIKFHLEAVKFIPRTSPALPNALTRLGCSLRNLYEHSGRLEDLEGAIDAFQKAVQLRPTYVALQWKILGNLGIALHCYYKYTGKIEKLEGAIEALQQALNITPRGSFDLPNILDGLGLCFYALYRRTGNLEDLDQAIAMHQEAVKQASMNSLALSGRFFSNLGNALFSRYSHRKQPEDLEHAFRVYQEAVDHTPDNAPELAGLLKTLSLGFYEFYRKLRRLDDLEQAKATLQRAIALVPINSPDLSLYFGYLGTILDAFYERSGRLEGLEQVITAYQKAVDLAADDFPELPGFLANLGTSLRLRYEHTKKQEDLDKGIVLYERACQKGGQIDINVVLASAYNWISWATERKSWAEAIQAYTYGKQAIEQLYRTQLLRTNQEAWLGEARDLYILAAYSMAQIGQLAEAVLTFERSRARGLNEALARDRANLERIQIEDQETYRLYQQITERLRQLERMEREESSLTISVPTNLASPSLLKQIQEVREELAQVIIRIRQIRGHEDFLAEPTYRDVVLATQPNVPLVYLATTSAGSLALLVHTAQVAPEVIWADDFTRDHLNTLLLGGSGEGDKIDVNNGYLFGQLFNSKWLSQTLADILPQLGGKLVGRLANRLRELRATGAILIPTGLLGLLPFHAAHYRLEDKDIYLLDEFDVAYVPSARVLTAIRHEAQARQVQGISLSLAGVGNPLPDPEVGAWAQGELRLVVPALQQAVQENLPQLQTDPAASSSEESNSTQSLIPLRVHTLERLQMLCQEPSEELIYAGYDLLHAALLFGQLSDLPGDIAATLARLAARIPPNLTYARAELESVLSLFPAEAVAALYDHQATRDAFWKALPKATIVHCSCHGSFDSKAALDSALLLARGTRLTLRDLLNAEPQHLARLRLIVLSACQTAIIGFQRVPDESVGLLSGFLQAGVPSTIGTLWSVNEVSTALLAIHFYKLYLLGDEKANLPRQQPAHALRLTQRWLRDLTNKDLLDYLQDKGTAKHLSPALLKELLPTTREAVRKGQGDEHPYADPLHWAAFVYYGTL